MFDLISGGYHGDFEEFQFRDPSDDQASPASRGNSYRLKQYLPAATTTD